MNQQLQDWQNKINALNQRERIILFATALVVVVMLIQIVLIDPALADRKKAATQLKNVTMQLQQQENEQQLVAAQIAAGVNRHKEKRKEQLAAEVETLNQQIEESVVAMIPPRLMPQVLESVLAQNKELKLISLENKLVIPVIEETADDGGPNAGGKRSAANTAGLANASSAAQKQGLYKHGFILTLSGNYLAAIRYFEELSALPWRFYWDDLHYEVDRYPNATITLEVHTVSMSEEWIGV